MMMNRHRSRARDTESRQPEEDGRRTSAASRLLGNLGNSVPRSPRSSAKEVMTTPPPSSNNVAAPSTPHSAPPPSNFPKTRCYRLNLEKPFDISLQKSPLGRDYSGPPIHDSDLPPAQGPVEYVPPMHLCTKEEMAWRRNSWGGAVGSDSVMSNGASNTPSELFLANLHMSVSEESSNSNAPDPTSIAISTACIFRGIVVDRNGVITSMNSRATRSQRGKNGGSEGKNKMGEKSRQAAKIDKAKDLIDEVAENGGAGGSDEENDPTKRVSLFVMGEYEDFTDLVRDGSKKLRDSKTLSDETMFMYNRPRQLPPSMQQAHPMSGVSSTNAGILSPRSVNGAASNGQYGAMSPSSSSNANPSISSPRKRFRHKQVPQSAPPKLKSHPRDTARSSSRRTSGGYHRASSNASQAQQYGGPFGCNPTTPNTTSKQSQQHQQQQAHPNYFQQQCNFFPGNSDWTENLGFSVNSLWNCGANGGHMSPVMTPNSHPSSPSSQHGHQQQQPATGGGVYHGSGSAAGYSSAHHHSSSGYHSSNNGYHQQHHHNSASGGYNNGGYTGYSTSPYHGTPPAATDEGRNPSYGYGRGASGAGVRDTVVM